MLDSRSDSLQTVCQGVTMTLILSVHQACRFYSDWMSLMFLVREDFLLLMNGAV